MFVAPVSFGVVGVFFFSLLPKKLFICISPEAVLNQASVSGRTPSGLTPKISRRLSAAPPLRPQRAGGGAGFNELPGQMRAPAALLTPASGGLGLPPALGGARGAQVGWAASPQHVGGGGGTPSPASVHPLRKKKTNNKKTQTHQSIVGEGGFPRA